MYQAHRGLLLGLSLCLVTAQVLHAELIFSLSHSKQCAPLNITWTPLPANYPYTVTIGAVGNGGELGAAVHAKRWSWAKTRAGWLAEAATERLRWNREICRVTLDSSLVSHKG